MFYIINIDRKGDFRMNNENKTCKVHYIGTFNDGTKFDSSYDRGETLEFVCGAGMMIKGFDEAVKTMKVGETKDIHLMPEDAYGFTKVIRLAVNVYGRLLHGNCKYIRVMEHKITSFIRCISIK